MYGTGRTTLPLHLHNAGRLLPDIGAPWVGSFIDHFGRGLIAVHYSHYRVRGWLFRDRDECTSFAELGRLNSEIA